MTIEQVKGLQPGDKVIWTHKALEWQAAGLRVGNKTFRHAAEVVYVQPEGRYVTIKVVEPLEKGNNIVDFLSTAWPEQITLADDKITS